MYNSNVDDNNYDDVLVIKGSNHSIKNLYTRMDDVELVLRFFAMRHLSEYSGDLSKFLDLCLIKYNRFSLNQLKILSDLFKQYIDIADSLFGNKAFAFYRKSYGKWSWSRPSKMIYDAMMVAIQELELSNITNNQTSQKNNIDKIQNFYKQHQKEFYGKVQSKREIRQRADLLKNFIKDNCT